MKIFNKTKKRLIAENAEQPTDLISKSIGLIGAKTPRALILKTRFGIHTFGVKFPIDVLVIDSESKVVSLREKLPPFSFYFWDTAHDTVIELPTGTIERTKTSLGDKISIED